VSSMLNAVLAVTVLQAGSSAPPVSESPARTDALAIQVALDRAGFSPGVIDGASGPNTTRALQAYRDRHGRDPVPHPEPTVACIIAEEDVNAQFVDEIPEDLVEQSKLSALTYTSTLELLAERYHATPQLLKRLNPDAAFAAGEAIQVPNVEPFGVPDPGASRSESGRPERGTSGREPPPSREAHPGAAAKSDAPKPDVVVMLSKSSGALTVRDASGRVVFYAPVTTGSDNDPLPIGEWKVTGVQYNPAFNYNPDLFWDADPSHAKARLAPGPNNPVGVVWIDLSKEHYGIHGTPEPSSIGKSESHGCVRMTNWDALELARLVKPGTRVVFTK
jgi:lipoprotein-anchoring transpeptidase ErfK/SrfK